MKGEQLYKQLKSGSISKSQLTDQELGDVYKFMVDSKKVSVKEIKPAVADKFNLQPKATVAPYNTPYNKPAITSTRPIIAETYVPSRSYDTNAPIKSANPENELVDLLSNLSLSTRYNNTYKPIENTVPEISRNLNAANASRVQENNPITWKDNPLQSAGQNIRAGWNQFGRALPNTIDMVLGDKNIPIVDNFLADQKRQQAEENARIANINKTPTQQFIGQSLQGVGQAIPYVAESLFMAPYTASAEAGKLLAKGGTQLVNNAAQLINPTTMVKAQQVIINAVKNPNLIPSMLQSVGSIFEESLSKGATREQAVNAAITGGVPAGLVEVMGGTEALAGKLASKMPIGKAAIESGLGEALEEVIQYTFENLGQKVAYDKDMPVFSMSEQALFNPKEQAFNAATAFTSSALMGGVGSGVNTLINKLQNSNIPEERKNKAVIVAQELDNGMNEIYAVIDSGEKIDETKHDKIIQMLTEVEKQYPELSEYLQGHKNKIDGYMNIEYTPSAVNNQDKTQATVQPQTNENIEVEQTFNDDTNIVQNANKDVTDEIEEIGTQEVDNVAEMKTPTIDKLIDDYIGDGKYFENELRNDSFDNVIDTHAKDFLATYNNQISDDVETLNIVKNKLSDKLQNDNNNVTVKQQSEIPVAEGKIETTKDNLGNELTPELQETFKDSKVKDKGGNLLVVYHGTDAKFDKFVPNYAPGWGTGIYLTDNEENAKEFGENVIKAYVDIKKPFYDNDKKVDISNTKAYKDYIKKLADNENMSVEEYEDEYDIDWELVWDDLYNEDGDINVIKSSLQELGYDGFIGKNSNNINGQEIVAFNPEQIQRVDNKDTTPQATVEPTTNETKENEQIVEEDNKVVEKADTVQETKEEVKETTLENFMDSIKLDDIDYKKAESAHRAISFDSEKRAKSIQKEYVETVNNVYKELLPLAKTDEQKTLLLEEMQKFKEKYIQMENTVLSATARTMSAAIVGPAKFPTARNQKAMDAEHKRVVEFLDWLDKAPKAIEKKLNNALPESDKANEVLNKLKKEVDDTIKSLIGIKNGSPYSPALFRSSLKGYFERNLNNGNIEEVRQAAEYLKEQEKEKGITVFTSVNSIWKQIENAKPKEVETGVSTFREYDGARIVENKDIDRIQLFFDEKPSEEVRTELKKRGWHYSKANDDAWQRKITGNALFSAEQVMDKFFKKQEVVIDKTEEVVTEMKQTEQQTYRYYLTQRPPSPGTFPKGTTDVVSFDDKTDGAWGYVEYDKPLTEKQIDDYELTEDVTETKQVDNIIGKKTNINGWDVEIQTFSETEGKYKLLANKGNITEAIFVDSKYLQDDKSFEKEVKRFYDNRLVDVEPQNKQEITEIVEKSEEVTETKEEQIEETKEELKERVEKIQETGNANLTPNETKMYNFLVNNKDTNIDTLMDSLEIPRSNADGFDSQQRYVFMKKLIEGAIKEDTFNTIAKQEVKDDKGNVKKDTKGEVITVQGLKTVTANVITIDIPRDGTFRIKPDYGSISIIINRLGIKLKSQIPTNFKSIFAKGLMLGDDFYTNGNMAIRANKLLLSEIKAEYKDARNLIDEKSKIDNIIPKDAKWVEVKDSPYLTVEKVTDSKGYFFTVEEKPYLYNQKYVDFLNKDGNKFYIDTKGFGIMKVENTKNESIGIVFPIRDNGINTDFKNGNLYQTTKQNFFSKPKESKAKGKTIKQEKPNQHELKNQIDSLMAKLAIAETEQEKAEISNKISSLKLQLFANGTSTETSGTGEFETSKFYTNSLKNALYIPENVKGMLDEVDFLYETQTNEGQLKQALQNIEKDMNLVISKIKNSSSLKGGVQSAEALLIHKIYIEQGKLSGDYSKAVEWSKTIRPKITNTAQSLQAISMFKRFTADNILLQATRTAEESRTRSEDDKIDKTADKIKADFDKAEKEKAQEVADDLEKNANDELAKSKAKKAKSDKKPTQEEIDEIEPSDLLVAKIESTLKSDDKEVKPIERDFISEMVEELFRVAKESPLPQQERISSETTSIDFMAQAIKNREMYKDTWLQAKDKLKEKYKDDVEIFKMLSDYFEKGIKPTFSVETLDKSISSYIIGLKSNKNTLSKDKLTNLSEVVKDWYATGKAKNESMVENIIKKSGLNEEDAKTLEKYIRNRMHSLTKQKKEQILSTMFKESVPKVASDSYKAIQEMTNLGAFNNQNYMEKAQKKLEAKLVVLLKENGIDLGKIAKQAASVGEFNKEKIVNLLRGTLEVNEVELEKVAKLVENTFNSLLKDKKNHLLKVITKEREATKKRAFYEKIVEIYNLGGFENKEYKELIAKKLNMPNIDDETVAKIVELATALESIPEKGMGNLILRDIIQNQMVYIVKNMVPASRWRKVSTVQAINQLLNGKTIDRNILGNELAYRSERMAKYLATIIDKGRTILTGGERKITFKAGTKIFDFDTRFTSNVQKAAMAAMAGTKLYGYDATSDTINLHKSGKTFKNAWNPFTYLETTMNVVLDGPDYAAAMRGVYHFVSEQAYLDGINKGLKGAELENNSKKFAEDLSFEAFKIAREYGDWVTFKDKDSILGNIFGSLKKSLNKIGNEEFGLGDILLKYARTGGVLLGRSIEFSPVGVLTSVRHIYQAKNAYEKKQEYSKDVVKEVEMSIARGIFGTIGFSGLGYALSALGIVSGDDDDEKLVSDLRRSVGLGNYQINMSALFRWITSFNEEEAKLKQGDKLFTYNWAMPMALSFGLGVDVERGFSKKSEDMGKGIVTGLVASIDGMMSMFGQSNIMTGINNLFKGYDTGRNVRYLAQNTVTGFTGTFNNQLRQFNDNVYRDTVDDDFVTETINKIKNRLPILSEALPESYDITGYPKEVFQNNSNSIFNVFFNPGFLTEYDASPGTELMLELYDDVESLKVIPNEAPKFITIDSIKVPLTKEERNQYAEILGRLTIDKLDSLAFDSEFKKLSTEEKVKRIDSEIRKISDSVRADMKVKIKQ